MGTGLWPFIDSDNLQKASGPKVGLWLVKTAGAFEAGIILIWFFSWAAKGRGE